MFNFPFGMGGMGGMGGSRFGGMGGMGGDRGPSSSRPPPREVDTTKLYETLGVEKTATAQQLRKAYRKLCVRFHPDKGGDADKFKEIAHAYGVLGDKEKRDLYDKYGEEGVKNGGPPMSSGADLFDILSGRARGGGGGARQRRRKRRGEDVMFPLKLSLEDMYCGATKKLRLHKNVLCSGCFGKGGSQVAECPGCDGTGVKLVIRQPMPGVITQGRQECGMCQGQGEVVPRDALCGTCHGRKTSKISQDLNVYVDPGVPHEHKIRFRGEGDQSPDTEPGDVIVVLQQREHPVFERRGDDLLMRKTITLSQALCGFKFGIRHLDQRVLIVSSEPGTCTRPGDLKCIANEGMPAHNQISRRGNLYVEFEVDFPAPGSLSLQHLQLLSRLLPPPPSDPLLQLDSQQQLKQQQQQQQSQTESQDSDDERKVEIDHVRLTTETCSEFKSGARHQQRSSRRREVYDDSDDEEMGGGGGGMPQAAECRAA